MLSNQETTCALTVSWLGVSPTVCEEMTGQGSVKWSRTEARPVLVFLLLLLLLLRSSSFSSSSLSSPSSPSSSSSCSSSSLSSSSFSPSSSPSSSSSSSSPSSLFSSPPTSSSSPSSSLSSSPPSSPPSSPSSSLSSPPPSSPSSSLSSSPPSSSSLSSFSFPARSLWFVISGEIFAHDHFLIQPVLMFDIAFNAASSITEACNAHTFGQCQTTLVIMLRVVKNVTWRQRFTNEVLYVGLPRISTTIRERRLRFSGHCWRSKNEVVSSLFLWEPKHGKRSIRGQACTFADLLEADTRVPRDCLLVAMDDRVGWRKKAMGV